MNFMLIKMPRSASAFIIVLGNEAAAVYRGGGAEACAEYMVASTTL